MNKEFPQQFVITDQDDIWNCLFYVKEAYIKSLTPSQNNGLKDMFFSPEYRICFTLTCEFGASYHPQ